MTRDRICEEGRSLVQLFLWTHNSQLSELPCGKAEIRNEIWTYTAA